VVLESESDMSSEEEDELEGWYLTMRARIGELEGRRRDAEAWRLAYETLPA
jgi:hypothetical protein